MQSETERYEKYRVDDAEYEEPTEKNKPKSPLLIPGVLKSFMDRYIPSEDESHATDVLTIGQLRNELCCWIPFGAVSDPLQGYLQILFARGFAIMNTSSGPAMCLVDKRSKMYLDIPSDESI